MNNKEKELEVIHNWLKNQKGVRIDDANDCRIYFYYTVLYGVERGIECAFRIGDDIGDDEVLRFEHDADRDTDFSGLFNFDKKSEAYKKVNDFCNSLMDFAKQNSIQLW